MEPSSDFHHYLPVTDSAMKSGAYVTGAGRGVIKPGSSYPTKGHPALYQFEWIHGRILPEYALILVTEGAGEYESKKSGIGRIDTDSVILLVPELWHRYRPDSNTGWTERWISFNGELAHRFCELGILKPGLLPLKPAHCTKLRQQFDSLLDGIHANPVSNSVSLAMQTMALVTIAIEQFTGDVVDSIPDTQDAIVREALEYIWTRSHYPLAVDKIAKELCVKRRTLDRRFVAIRGRTILEEINHCRITRAKRLLTETNIPVKSVTRLAGFTSNERMRLAFLECESVPPSEYRKRHKELFGRHEIA